MVEKTPERKAIFITVEKIDRMTLNNIIAKYVKNGSTIYTDQWKGYFDFNSLDYQHFTINHTIEFVIPNTNILTNTIKALGVG